jgi:hypothetical protein
VKQVATRACSTGPNPPSHDAILVDPQLLVGLDESHPATTAVTLR